MKNFSLVPRSPGKISRTALSLAAFAFGFCSGAKSISDVERLDADPVRKALLGAKRFPDQSALGEWLRNIGEAGIRELRLLVRDFTGWALKRAKPAMIRHAGMLEAFFDDTQIEVEGKRFEAAKINCNAPPSSPS